jgi:YHS domain-containing protein
MARKQYSFDQILKMKWLLLTLFYFCSASALFSQTDAFRIKQFNLDDGIAIKGYDPVAYFIKGKAEKGKSAFSSSYHGVNYHFANAADLNSFQANPEKYEPQYGGWCAYAMGHDGSKVEVDPETFKIINGKLFLFYNRFFNNTLKTWNQDESKLHAQADTNWQHILKQST